MGSRKKIRGGSNALRPTLLDPSNYEYSNTLPLTTFQPETFDNFGEPLLNKPILNSASCESLYDPCTKYPLANLSELEKRVRELKQSFQKKIDERVELPETIVSRLDLLLFILNQEREPDLFLLEYKKGEQTGQIFEAYWDIVFALGLIDRYPLNKNYYMYNGNIDGITSMSDGKLIQNPLTYLASRGVNMGASGASDITFVYKEVNETLQSDPCSYQPTELGKKPKFIFCSSKLFKNDKKKTIEKYDIQKIYTAAKNLMIDYDYEIVLLVQNREVVIDKIKRAISQYISEEASAVFGTNDLIVALRKFYQFIHKRVEGPLTSESLQLTLQIQDSIKPILTLRFHQDLAVYKMKNAIQRFKSNPKSNNKFLVGILPRGGKTYIAGGIIRDLNPKRVVVLLGAKTETLEQFKADLFEKYQDFSSYTILHVRDETSSFALDESKKYIFIMSIELYKKQDSSRRLLIDLKSEDVKKRADLFICDEAHLKQVTERAATEMKRATEKEEDEKALKEVDSLLSKSVPVVYMTGTYLRPMSAFKIPYENIVIWDYEDLQMGKKIAEDDTYFRNTYGETYELILSQQIARGETLETIAAMYKKFPDLHLLTTQFEESAKAAFSDQGAGKGFATIQQTFRLRAGYKFWDDASHPENWYQGFQNQAGVFRLINYLSAPDWDVGPNNGEIESVGSVMKSVDRISQRLGDRLAFLTTAFVPHTQIWFLPQSTDRVFNRMPILGSAILRNDWFRKHFNVLCVSDSDWRKQLGKSSFELSYSDYNGKISLGCEPTDASLKQCILREENAARKEKKGLIILAQKMLQVGISLPCADVVVLLDTGENVDERIQKMFRALTESPFKKAGYIVDMNYFRTVKAIMDYKITSYKVKNQKRDVTLGEAKQLFNKVLDLYYIDDDKPVYRETIEKTIPELQTMIQKEGVGDMRIEDAGKLLNANVKNILLGEYESMYETFVGMLEAEKEVIRKMRNEGRNVEKAENESNSNSESTNSSLSEIDMPKIFSDEAEEDEVKRKEAFLDIFRTVLKLGIFTTEDKTIEDLIIQLEEDEEFRNVVYETLVKRGDIVVPGKEEDLERQIDYIFNGIIIPNLEKILEKGRQESYKTMKEEFNETTSTGDKRIDEVLKYIVTHLAPKDKERQKYGEVFTPLTLVDEMLSKLPEEVWSNPDLKWLDPANGMGNFPIKAFLGQDKGEFTYKGLYQGLQKKIPNNSERCKHIIENMLFMIDINGKNNRVARTLFEKLCPGAKPNIEQIDKKNGFLSSKPLKFNEKVVENFDIIMGNPPFNPPKTDTGSSGNSIWQNFVMKSFNLLNKKGYLCYIHPPGWKKPTEELYKVDKFKSGDFTGQIRQGQVWQVLKDSGNFTYIYTNDQKAKSVGTDYIDFFPAVDFYIYQKDGSRTSCNTKNIFIGQITESKNIRLNYNLEYLPNLINKASQDILNKVTSKEGDKSNFIRFRSAKGFSVDSSKGKYKYIYTYNKKGERKYQYSDILNENVTMDKVVMNFDGGIDSYTVEFIKKDQRIGSYEMTMYTKIDSEKEGTILTDFFNSDIVKFIFLITQYASGKMTKNEPLVANSITIPSDGIKDYYKFFDIEEHKKYIEEVLEKYTAFKAPKRAARTAKLSKMKGGKRFAKTRKVRRS